MWTTSNDVATVFADRYLPDFMLHRFLRREQKSIAATTIGLTLASRTGTVVPSFDGQASINS